MSNVKETPVIRVVKRKAEHGAHHGGSWKVAYADFVTAMMAFFLVMWIVSMNQQVREDIQNYFNNPSAAAQSRAGISKLASGGMSPIASGAFGVGAKSWRELALEAQREHFSRVRDTLEVEIAGRPDLSRLRKHVDINVTPAGLDIELVEAAQSTFFQSGSAVLPHPTVKLLALFARELGHVPNPISIEGHTDSVPYRGAAGYTNWELSADRANAARRVMEASGLRPRQVTEIRGYADSEPRDPRHPASAVNRRVSILVRFVQNGQSPANDAEADVNAPLRLRFQPME